MINSASKCHKITLKDIKFSNSKPEKQFPNNQVEGDIPLESFEGGGFIPPPPPPLAETLCIDFNHFTIVNPLYV
jgi:hypothetical protein